MIAMNGGGISARSNLLRGSSVSLGGAYGDAFGVSMASGGGLGWPDVFASGINLAGQLIQARQPQQFLPQVQTAQYPQLPGAVATPASIAQIAGVIAAAGGRIVGQVIRISRAAWASIPAAIKQLAVALGLTVAFDAALGDENGAPRRRRRRGITATQLTGFNKVVSLLSRVGMTPRRLGGAKRRRICK